MFVLLVQYDGSQAAALRQLVSALDQVGATVQQQTSEYIYATAPGPGSNIDLEFLFAPNDNTVRCHFLPDSPVVVQYQAAVQPLAGMTRCLLSLQHI